MKSAVAIAINGQTDSELTQAALVEVNERVGQTSAFSLRFDLVILKGDLPYLADKRLDAGSELSVMVSVDQASQCLVKGPIHGQNIHLVHGSAGSVIDIKGSDSSVKMDRESRSVVWKDLTDSDAVQTIISTYGYTPDVETTTAGHYENKHTLVQRESDLSFVRRLARRNGYHFWITCDDKGIETAHFRRPQLGNTPTAQLVINLDSPTTTILDLNWDVERPTSIEGVQLDLNAKSDITVSVPATPQTILGDFGIAAITGDTRSVFLAAPANDAGDLKSRGEGALIEADWFIHATCKTTVQELGTVVRPHTILELRGAGSRHSGKYFVSSVRHTIDAIEHRMEIQLLRNGWGK
jgi:hypothetical protein